MLGPSDTLHLRRLVPALADRGHKIHVVSMKPDPISGATFERFKVPPFGRRYPHRWRRRWERYMEDLFKRFDAVTVHFLSDWGVSEETARRGRLLVRTYGSDVDPPPDSPAPAPGLVRARQMLIRAARKVVAPSRALAYKVADLGGVDLARIEVIPDGVDLEMFVPRPRRESHSCTVGYFKGFEPVYGPMTMIEAIPHVLSRCPEARFDLVGGGSLLEVCRQRAEELGVSEAVQWRERQPHEAMPGIMAEWDVVAVTSRKESLGVAALEAAAMELPVVATKVGGLLEVVRHGETGLLVEADNPRALANALVSLLENPERRRTLGVRARQHVAEHFEWNHYVDRWVELYEAATESPPTPGRMSDVPGRIPKADVLEASGAAVRS